MTESHDVTTQNGGPPPRALETTSCRHMLANEILTRKVKRTCTQKLTIPSLKKHTGSNKWWRKYCQYERITKGKHAEKSATVPRSAF